MNKIEKFKGAFRQFKEDFRKASRIEKLYFKDKWYECIEECNIEIDSGKTDFFVYYYLGLSKSQLKFLDESTEHLKKALAFPDSEKQKNAINKYRSYAKYQISVNYRKQRKYEKAIRHLDDCILEEPDYLNYYHLKANIYEDMKKTELAIEAVSNGLAVEPKNKELIKLKQHLAYSYSLEQSEKRNGG